MATLNDIKWAENDVTLAGAGTDNKIDPDQSLKDTGFDLSTKPTAQEENYWRHSVQEWIEELDGRTISGISGAYPVGSVYMNVSDNTNPATLLGFGTWTALAAGRVLIGDGQGTDINSDQVTFTAGTTGGEYNHTLTVGEMPNHDHGIGGIGLVREDKNEASGTGPDYDPSDPDGNYITPVSEGSNQSHNNIQPYLVVYMWQRTA